MRTIQIQDVLSSGSRKVTIADTVIHLTYKIDFTNASDEQIVDHIVEQAVVNITNKLFRKLTPEQVREYDGKTVQFNATAGKPDINELMRRKLRAKGLSESEIDELLS